MATTKLAIGCDFLAASKEMKHSVLATAVYLCEVFHKLEHLSTYLSTVCFEPPGRYGNKLLTQCAIMVHGIKKELYRFCEKWFLRASMH